MNLLNVLYSLHGKGKSKGDKSRRQAGFKEGGEPTVEQIIRKNVQYCFFCFFLNYNTWPRNF